MLDDVVDQKPKEIHQKKLSMSEKLIKDVAIGLIKRFGINPADATDFAMKIFRERIQVVQHSYNHVNMDTENREYIEMRCFQDIALHIKDAGFHQQRSDGALTTIEVHVLRV